MSCTLAATATQYTTITTFTTSTSLSQSVLNNQATVTTIVQQTCIATGTLSGSNSTGCLSSAAVTQVNTIGGGAVTTQVPIIVTVPVTQTQPTNTLFASCSDGSTPSQTTSHDSTTGQTSSSSTPSPVTTSVLIETTPAPSIITQSSSTTLSNGDVVATLVTTTSTLPASSVYVPSVIASPSVTGTKSGSGSGTDVAPIVGGVLGGFVGLIVVVSALWYFCRRRRSWDDIFDREAIEDEEFDSPVAVRRSRDRTMLDLGAEPKPYQYGLVGHVTPPPGSGSSPSSHHPSFSASVASTHSRNTSVTPLLGISSAPGNTSRVSISGSTQAAQTAAAQRHLSATSQSTSQSSVGLRSLSVVSTSSATPLLGGSGSSSLSLGNRVDELGAFDPLNRTGSPAPVIDRRVLQIINDGPQSPKSIASPAPAPTLAPVLAPTLVPAPASSSAPARPPGKRAPRRRRSNGVVVHTDAGSVSPNTGGTTPNEPPPYSRE